MHVRGYGHDKSLEEIQETIFDKIDTYIDERIIKAQDVMAQNAASLFSRDKPETIMVIGTNYVFDLLF